MEDDGTLALGLSIFPSQMRRFHPFALVKKVAVCFFSRGKREGCRAWLLRLVGGCTFFRSELVQGFQRSKFHKENFRESTNFIKLFEDAFFHFPLEFPFFFGVAKDWYYQKSWGKLPQKPIISHTERQRQSRRSFGCEQRPLRWATRRAAKTGASKGKGLWSFFIQKQQDDKLSGDKIRQNDQHAPYLLSLSVFSCQFTCMETSIVYFELRHTEQNICKHNSFMCCCVSV